ncbi:hypothetical protein ACQKDW_01400 [Bacillus mycoides]|uniref:hypothetical protein n=1 Tax=Bacillus mycoides TaxID=1405 RepID=UPI003CFC892B
MDKQHSSVFTSSTTSSEPIPKEDKVLEKEITSVIRDVLNDLKINLKSQKLQVKKDVRNAGAANKQEILKNTQERLQSILTDTKEQIRTRIEKIQNEEEAVIVPIEEETEKEQDNK